MSHIAHCSIRWEKKDAFKNFEVFVPLITYGMILYKRAIESPISWCCKTHRWCLMLDFYSFFPTTTSQSIEGPQIRERWWSPKQRLVQGAFGSFLKTVYLFVFFKRLFVFHLLKRSYKYILCKGTKHIYVKKALWVHASWHCEDDVIVNRPMFTNIKAANKWSLVNWYDSDGVYVIIFLERKHSHLQKNLSYLAPWLFALAVIATSTRRLYGWLFCYANCFSPPVCEEQCQCQRLWHLEMGNLQKLRQIYERSP